MRRPCRSSDHDLHERHAEWRQVAAVGGAAAQFREDDRKSLPAEHREQFLDSAHDDALQ
jgi:hypothetical protein